MENLQTSKTNQGLTRKNQISVLERLNENGISKYSITGGRQEVIIHTSRREMIQLINNLLNNKGDVRQLSLKDNCKRINDVLESVFCDYPLYLSDFIDWYNAKMRKYVGKSIYKKLCKVELTMVSCKRVKRGEWYIIMTIESQDTDFWEETILLFPQREWLIDKYLEVEDKKVTLPNSSIYNGSIIMSNNEGIISFQNISFENRKNLEDICPIHYEKIQYGCFIQDLFQDTLIIKKVTEKDFPLYTSRIYGEGEYVHNLQEYKNVIKKNYKKMNIRSFQWNGLIDQLKEEKLDKIKWIDKFGSYYFPSYLG